MFSNNPVVVDAEKGGGLLPTVHAAMSTEEVTIYIFTPRIEWTISKTMYICECVATLHDIPHMYNSVSDIMLPLR